ncbi:interactor of HORMAD1 protein 1 isoform X2 [Phyllopteryx taeniolatus]|uniref:interactor of HORMAD1 protein 1 isoform X2 n=1 Tax=Phyllopteryx taeniolatus TaxID=161469 RepID=UPI002AD595DF|nr:interactor of HORMAD1 protein 1 isoform X2 [Phyllopteryx taeniolatus]XP_061641314.1 interactor of HORMAD1 protein 1 isoform X2 [Phyllopteryx taeniolatus]XP_061641315.1 interactor of HORMAD1 protein 1 isoform X2 [Phyllopteryx taeniolatus]
MEPPTLQILSFSLGPNFGGNILKVFLRIRVCHPGTPSKVHKSDRFAKECLQIHETLTKIQQLVANTDENTSVCQTVLQKLSNLSSTLENVSSMQSDISQQFKTLLNTVNSQKEMMTELGKRVQKNGDSSTEFAANMRSDVDCLRREQEEASSKQESMLEEALQMLNALVSEHPGKLCSVKVTDKAMQTSPGQDKGTQMAQNSCTPDSQVPDLDIAVKMRKKKPTSRYRRRPLVRHRSNHIVVEENSQPVMDCSKQRNVSRPLRQSPGLSKVSAHGPESLVQSNTKSRSSETAGCFITPLSCWSQESSGSESPRKVNCSSEIVLRDSSPPDALWQLFL